jgi:hypothetical protein
MKWPVKSLMKCGRQPVALGRRDRQGERNERKKNKKKLGSTTKIK